MIASREYVKDLVSKVISTIFKKRCPSYCVAYPSTNTAYSSPVNTVFRFNASFKYGDKIAFDASTFSMKLKAGSTYKVEAYCYFSNTSTYYYYSIYNKTAGAYTGLGGLHEKSGTWCASSPAMTIITPSVDTVLDVRVTGCGATQSPNHQSISKFIVEEIGGSKV